jgi:GrpB-like predicted nucleotidyltransferase (UPF0157 family)
MPALGLSSGSVHLHAYEDEWPRLFLAERALLLSCLGDEALEIEHVGSTAIRGMPAKPILDISVAVSSFEDAVRCVPLLEEIGYAFRGEQGIPRRHFFVKGDPVTHHLHMLEADSEPLVAMLRFRDYLLEHPDVAAAYAALKFDLAQQHSNDRVAYTDGKTSFVQGVLGQASR